ncbi:MAG: hypothetical protein KAI28_03555 [Sphingomonadales bacterium]|nr:hypothetical protein [Sphingomonadales bacterium]
MSRATYKVFWGRNIFQRMRTAFSMKRGREAATQFALFAMFVQALIPLSAGVSLPGTDAQARSGQDIPGFYSVFCTFPGAKASDQVGVLPSSGDRPVRAPWDCPVCQAQPNVQGPAPSAPKVAFAPHTLPHASATAIVGSRVLGHWTSAPGLARAPPPLA